MTHVLKRRKEGICSWVSLNSLCNDDTVSGNALSTTDITRSWRKKKRWRFPDIPLCCNIWRRSEVVSVLDWGTAQAPSNFPVPRTHTNFYVSMKEDFFIIIIFKLQTDISFLVTELPEEKWLGLDIQLPFIYQGIGFRAFRHLRSIGKSSYGSRNLYTGLFGFLLKY